MSDCEMVFFTSFHVLEILQYHIQSLDKTLVGLLVSPSSAMVTGPTCKAKYTLLGK